jgi:hypothetical protein
MLTIIWTNRISITGREDVMSSTVETQIKELWENIKEIPTSILRIEDLHNKLSLCAVVSGEKNLASIEPEDDKLLPNLQDLRKILRRFNLLTSVNTLRRIQPSLDKTNLTPKIRSYFKELSASQKPTILLWAFRNKQVQTQIKHKMTNSQIGNLLGYPSHCIQEYNKYIILNTLAYVAALKSQYDSNIDEKIIDLIKRNASVTYLKRDNTVKTLKQFPFLPYVACNKCLAGEYDTSSKINSKMKDLARRIDDKLYNEILIEANRLVRLSEQQ